MNHSQFRAAIEKNDIARAVLLHGPEEYIKKVMLKRLLDAVLEPGFEDINHTSGENLSADDIIALCETLPMFGGRRVVEISGSPLVGPGRMRDEAREAKRLTEYIQKLPETACLIFNCTQADMRKSVSKEIAKRGQAVEFKHLDGAELERTINALIRRTKKTAARGVPGLIADIAGDDLSAISGEIEKLAAFAGERTEITAEDVRAVVTPGIMHTVFQMIDAMMAGARGDAFLILKGLLDANESRIGIIAMLTRQYRIIRQVKDMDEVRTAQSQMQAVTKQPGFAMARTLRQANGFTREEIEKCVDMCIAADYDIKSGAAREDEALDRLMLALCFMKGK